MSGAEEPAEETGPAERGQVPGREVARDPVAQEGVISQTRIVS